MDATDRLVVVSVVGGIKRELCGWFVCRFQKGLRGNGAANLPGIGLISVLLCTRGAFFSIIVGVRERVGKVG